VVSFTTRLLCPVPGRPDIACCIGDWVSPEAGLDAMEYRKHSYPDENLEKIPIVQLLNKTHHTGMSFLKRERNSRCTVITDLDTSKRSTQKALYCCDATPSWKPVPRPRIKHEKRTVGSAWKLGQFPLLSVYVVPAYGEKCISQ
jgi:hypothetical protein